MRSSTHEASPTFESVYRGQFEFVWRSLRALGVHHGALDDALQDVFVVVHRRLTQFEGRASIGTWVYEIARRVALSYRRRAAQHATRHSEMPDLRASDDLDGAVDAARATEVLQSFLRGLDEDRRRAFVLAEFWDMPGREIAEALEVNMNTVYARLRSARTELDRVAHRMRARDAGALTRAFRSDRPSAARRRRTLAGVLSVIDKPVAVAVVGSTSAGALVWAAVGAAASGVVLLALVGIADARAPAVGPPSKAASGAVAPLGERAPVANPARRAEPVSPPATVTAAVPEVAPQPSKPSPVAHPPAGPAPVAADDGEHDTTLSLSDQLARVRAIRDAVRDKDETTARSRIRAYRQDVSGGTLEVEVDALEVELACRVHADDAEAKLQAFGRARNDDALAARLETVCGQKVGPQKAAGNGTHP